jgi:ankyrin repeat protein
MEVFSATSSGAEGNLFDAAGEGDLARVKALIEAKADVNAKDTYRATALKYASSAGHVEVVKLLRKAGAKE